MNMDLVKLRKENEELREEIKQLREHMRPWYWFPTTWGLTRHEGEVMSALMSRGVMTPDQIFYHLYSHLPFDQQPQSDAKNVVGVWIMKIRRKIRPHGIGIINQWGVGFFIAEDDKVKIHSHIEAAQ